MGNTLIEQNKTAVTHLKAVMRKVKKGLTAAKKDYTHEHHPSFPRSLLSDVRTLRQASDDLLKSVDTHVERPTIDVVTQAFHHFRMKVSQVNGVRKPSEWVANQKAAQEELRAKLEGWGLADLIDWTPSED